MIAQWILEITDILMNKILSFLYVSDKKKIARLCRAISPPPPNPKTVPTALL